MLIELISDFCVYSEAKVIAKMFAEYFSLKNMILLILYLLETT